MCEKKVYVKNEVVSVFNYAWRQEDVWDQGGTTPRIFTSTTIYGDDRSASRPKELPPRKDPPTANRWRTLGRDFDLDSVVRRKSLISPRVNP